MLKREDEYDKKLMKAVCYKLLIQLLSFIVIFSHLYLDLMLFSTFDLLNSYLMYCSLTLTCFVIFSLQLSCIVSSYLTVLNTFQMIHSYMEHLERSKHQHAASLAEPSDTGTPARTR